MKRRFLNFCGVACLLLSILIAVGWTNFLGPYRQSIEILKLKQNWRQLEWNATQKYIRRIGWLHDSSNVVGRWGDEVWVAKIIENLEHGDDISSCSAGHKDIALRMMTNQDIGESAEKWIEWWQVNKHKNQLQWITEGFKKIGLKLRKPLLKEDIIGLLRIMGSEKIENENFEYTMNAFRWLRNSDFSEKLFFYEDVPSNNPNEVMNGLKKYCSWKALWPKNLSPHTLVLGERQAIDNISWPGICSVKTKILVWLLIIANFSIGVIILYKARKHKGATGSIK